MKIFRKQPAPPYTVLEPRNVWHIKWTVTEDGERVRKDYREHVVRRHADNALRIYWILEAQA
jgi:hypothetical protein